MALLAVGTPAPTFKAMNLTGPEIDLENYKGKKSVILMFSGTRVDPVQIKTVADLHKKHRDKAEIISISFKLPSLSTVKYTMQSLGAKFPATYDPDQKIYKLYGVENPVALVVVDTTGNITYAVEGLETKSAKALEEVILTQVK